MWRTKESAVPGDEARGGNWFQMKQEVESEDKEKSVLYRGKEGVLNVDANSNALLPGH